MNRILQTLLLSWLVLLAGCSDKAPETAAETKSLESASALPKIAFIYIGTIGDEGWTYEHNRGRLYLEEKLDTKITYVENVPESADAERILSQLAQDHDIIFATSFGHMDYVHNAAERFPKVKFLHAAGYKSADNMGNFFARNWEGSYLAGIAAGMVTKTNKLGYLASFPIPQLVYNINAYTLGAQSVNPDVEVSIVWNNSWYDPANERSAAMSMADEGMDVLASYPDSPATIKVAQERGVWGVGNSTEMAHYAPDAYLTNPIWNWGLYYEKAVAEIMDGTWKGGSYLGGMEDGMIDIAEFGPKVPEAVKTKVNEVKALILADKFNVFDGPLIDQSGATHLAEGSSMPDTEVLQMNWFVKGVKGSLPK
jgi:basic membrane protein A